MKQLRIVFLLTLSVCFVFAGLSRGLSGARPAFEAQVVFESNASPTADPDPRDETALAVSPLNNQIIAGCSKLILGGGTGSGISRVAYYYSSDGGHSWGNGVLPLETPQKTWNRASDPSIAVDSNGNFFIGALLLDTPGASFDSAIYIYKSTDSGRTFGVAEPVTLDIAQASPKFLDKCYITIDTSPDSPFRNTIHATWVTSTGIEAAHRKPNEGSFSPVINGRVGKPISHSGTHQGPVVATGPGGEAYFVWEGLGGPDTLLFNASVDGGDTFLPSSIAHNTDFRLRSYQAPLKSPGPLEGIHRVNSFPSMDVDRSNGPNRGMIYIAWAEFLNGHDADVFVIRVTPANLNTQTPPTIATGPTIVSTDLIGADQVFPWLKVDEGNGDVEVAFYDRRDGPSGFLNTYIARSTDGGTTFAENLRVSGVSSDPSIQASVVGSFDSQIGIGDYLGMFSTAGRAHLFWTDTRNQKQEAFYGLVEFGPSGGGGGGGGNPPPNDECSSPRVAQSLPFSDELATGGATTGADDPASCAGGTNHNSVWYAFTSPADTTIGIDSSGSDYDTVLSVYTGTCGSLTTVGCNDDLIGNKALLTFAARSGVNYLIEVAGKSGGGTLRLRIGFPTVSLVDYTTAPDSSQALMITGASFQPDNTVVTVRKDGVDTNLPRLFFTGSLQGDGTVAQFFATKKKLKKLIKKGNTVTVIVESPAGSGHFSEPFTFTR